MIHPQMEMGPNLTPPRLSVHRYQHSCLEWGVPGRDRFRRPRRRPQEGAWTQARAPRPARTASRPHPAHHPAPQFPPDAGGPGSFADVTPQAEVTFSRGWTRCLVAGRGRACPVFLRGRSNYFCNGSREKTGVCPDVRESSLPGPPHRSSASAPARRHAAQSPPESSRRLRRRTPGTAAAATPC